MQTGKKNKQQKIEQEQVEVKKPEKKHKFKKKKKDHGLIDFLSNPQAKSNSIKETIDQTDQVTPIRPQIKHSADPIDQELSRLQYDGSLTACEQKCELINSNLEQVTINLYESMIMRGSLIKGAITEAKNSGMTPKQYFTIDYTNKLLLIKNLLLSSAGNKFNKYVELIEREVVRVEQLILRSLEQVKTYEEVLTDLKKSNLEWTILE